MKLYDGYLTEEKLGAVLALLFPDKLWIRDQAIPNSGCTWRPDYRCDELKLIVEFDGFQHYTKTKQIVKDYRKDHVFNNLGYKIIRIPYFVQLSKEMIKHYFDIEIDEWDHYPHGFIDKKAVLPEDYCLIGVERFLDNLCNLPVKLHLDIANSCLQELSFLKQSNTRLCELFRLYP